MNDARALSSETSLPEGIARRSKCESRTILTHERNTSFSFETEKRTTESRKGIALFDRLNNEFHGTLVEA